VGFVHVYPQDLKYLRAIGCTNRKHSRNIRSLFHNSSTFLTTGNSVTMSNISSSDRESKYESVSKNNGLTANSSQADASSMDIDKFTPFMSHAFCRNYKIFRTKRITIRPGEISVQRLLYPWHKHTPAHYTVTTTGAATSWGNRTKVVTQVKGERFILFKLHSNVGGISGQTTLEKDVGQTTPTIVMETLRTYFFKHLPLPAAPAIDWTTAGHQAGVASIIVDSDEVKGAEIDAS